MAGRASGDPTGSELRLNQGVVEQKSWAKLPGFFVFVAIFRVSPDFGIFPSLPIFRRKGKNLPSSRKWAPLGVFLTTIIPEWSARRLRTGFG